MRVHLTGRPVIGGCPLHCPYTSPLFSRGEPKVEAVSFSIPLAEKTGR
jgi:hypothetical protein